MKWAVRLGCKPQARRELLWRNPCWYQLCLLSLAYLKRCALHQPTAAKLKLIACVHAKEAAVLCLCK